MTVVNASSSATSALISTAKTISSPRSALRFTDENVATIDQLPRGMAHNAARTPRKDIARTGTLSKQLTSNEASNVGEDAPCSEPETSPSRRGSNGPDLARKAARRVNVWKKTEQDKRGEEERARQAKHEQEKKRQNHAAHAKQRRRAEIYALNALLRQLQQEKIARYIAAQKEAQEQADSQTGASLTNEATLRQVQAVGV
ncbi:hypothetical protein P3T76_010279 [Phytophthora citrophthora]|uniref:Small vasohibin-binding protein n=1 Tax=Phytophthora citrophthora TaxID=4793 RepID=A0AAD9GC18_9STRA|nr:hypothetical protein P3T76_010279 [Phytophthora citrophthora]